MNRSSLNIIGIALIIVLHLSFSASGQDQSSFKIPQYEKFTLGNGLTIYLMEQHEVPIVYVSSIFPAGAVRDEDDKGLAFLTSESLLFGTVNYTKDDIEQTFDFLGADISSMADLEGSKVNLSFKNTDADKLLPIFKEIITSPVFPRDEFDKRKERLIQELDQEKESPRRVMDRYFRHFIYGDNPYGNPFEGTKSSLDKIDVNSVKDFYARCYIPSQSAIAVVGDFSAPLMKQKISDLFSGWKPGFNKSEKSSITGFPEMNSSRVLLVNKNDSNESTFYIGGYGVSRNEPDNVGINVVNTILGGRFTSWLNDELRVNAGLTYGAGSSFSRYRDSGLFVIYSFTKTTTTTDAIDLALQVLHRLHTKGIDEQTLNSAKNYIKGQFPPDYETSGSLANLLTTMFFYNLDDSYINDFEKNVDAITTDDASRIIAKYFPENNLQFVIIGKASELKDRVSRYGTITEKEIKDDGY
jgi:zinc protease